MCMSRLCNGAGLRRRGAPVQELVYRTARPPVRPVRPPAPRIIQNTVHQTVVHLHQTVHRHITRLAAAPGGRGRAAPSARPAPAAPAGAAVMDPSRPARTARRLLRILSAESARQAMRPFYWDLLRRLLAKEREERRKGPGAALLHGLVLHRYVRSTVQTEEHIFLHRYAVRELPMPDDLRLLPAALRLPPPGQPQQPQPASRPPEAVCQPLRSAGGGSGLSDTELRALAGRVADALDRQGRLEALRRGGM